MNKAEKYLHYGIRAYNKGDRQKAKKYFKAALKYNKKSEKAWRMLAKVVSSREDRITCLKNILVINPGNMKARQSLKRLTGEFETPVHSTNQFDVSVRQQSINKFSPYFDDDFHAQLDAENHKVKFNDVWEETVPMCAYCATDISRSQNKCPKCKRKLFGWVLSEPSVSQAVKIWILLRALIHIQLIIVYFLWFIPNQDLIVTKGILPSSMISIVGYGLIIGQITGAGLTIMLWFRKVEAFWLSVFGSLVATLLVAYFLRFQLSSMSLPFGIVYGLLYCTAVFFSTKAYPNFEQNKQKITAQVNPNITNVNKLDHLAHGYAKLGMWGTAVQHWRKAIQFQIDHPKINAHLANGYLQLGFDKRAIDQYEKAITFSNDPKLRQALSHLQKENLQEDALSPINSSHPIATI